MPTVGQILGQKLIRDKSMFVVEFSIISIELKQYGCQKFWRNKSLNPPINVIFPVQGGLSPT